MASTRCTACSKSSLTTTYSYSSTARNSCNAECNRATSCSGDFGFPGPEPVQEHLPGRREDENGHDLRKRLPHLPRALDVDVHDDVLAARQDPGDLTPKRPVQIPVHFRRLGEFPRGAPAKELLAGEEMVVGS
jgi:hypothetical protein